MLVDTNCFHSFHIPCFQEYAKKTLLTRKKTNEVEFEELKCGRC